MKPQTKLQKKVVTYSKLIKPVTEKDKSWASEELFGGYYVRCRNRNNCLECGHKWKPEGSHLGNIILKPTCPKCGAKDLKHVDGWSTDHSVYEYWAIIEVVKGFQVVRMFMAKKYMKRKQPATYTHMEVMQHWVRKDGKTTSLTLMTNSMGYHTYIDSWASGGELEPRTDSRNHRIRCGLAPHKIRPGRSTLPIIRRNGYDGYFKDEAPQQFFSAILKYPQAETLLKAGQISLFKKCVGVDELPEDIDNYWDSICIAIRNNYIVEDASDWFDYLGMLDQFDKDLNNAFYVCPEDFEQAHNRYNEKVRELNRKERLEEMKQRISEENPEYIKRIKPFIGICIKYDRFEIVPLKSVKEVMIEGDKLHHCIFNRGYYKKEHSLLLSARIDGEPIETVEVNLLKLEIKQARGLQNKATEYHDTIVEAVRSNMNKIASIVSKNNLADFEDSIKREIAA